MRATHPDVNRSRRPGDHLDELAAQTPKFHAAVLAELRRSGTSAPPRSRCVPPATPTTRDTDPHGGQIAECSHQAGDTSPVNSAAGAARGAPCRSSAPRSRSPSRPMVRAIWLLRNLLRELGRRLAKSGVLGTADDVFYLLVDDSMRCLPTLLGWSRGVAQNNNGWPASHRPRLQWHLADHCLPGDCPRPGAINGVGVCSGLVRGRVRIVRRKPSTPSDRSVLVAKVTEVGPPPPSPTRRRWSPSSAAQCRAPPSSPANSASRV